MKQPFYIKIILFIYCAHEGGPAWPPMETSSITISFVSVSWRLKLGKSVKILHKCFHTINLCFFLTSRGNPRGQVFVGLDTSSNCFSFLLMLWKSSGLKIIVPPIFN